MSVITTNFSDFFTNAAVIVTNAQEQPEIAAALDAFGYDADAIQEGQELLTTARALYDAQIKEYGEQHAAPRPLPRPLNRPIKATPPIAAWRPGLQSDAQRQTDLRLNTAKPRTFTPGMSRPATFTPPWKPIPPPRPNWPALKSPRKPCKPPAIN
jgi:hypothetical protein